MARAALYAIALAVLAAAAPAPVRAQTSTVETVAWMQGCWLASSGSSNTEEVWMAPRGGLMMGMSRSVRDGSARGYEFVLLREVEGDLVFTPHPSGQSPADFIVTSATADLLRVENASHDFPQKIEYLRVPPDSVIASVYGDVGSTSPAFEVRYGRASCRSEPG